jgi:hypothetical protein
MPSQRWTPEDDLQLANMLREGLSAAAIAVFLNRKNRTDVFSRVQRLARKRLTEPNCHLPTTDLR